MLQTVEVQLLVKMLQLFSADLAHKKNKKQNKKHNLGQKVGDKLTKLSKIGFSMECFIADFLRLFTKTRQNLATGWTARYSPSNPSISRIFLKFPKVLSRSATRTLTFW